jgi:hypothetical protein
LVDLSGTWWKLPGREAPEHLYGTVLGRAFWGFTEQALHLQLLRDVLH